MAKDCIEALLKGEDWEIPISYPCTAIVGDAIEIEGKCYRIAEVVTFANLDEVRAYLEGRKGPDNG